MYDLSRHIANIKSAIKAKQAPIKVAQTRLELRTHRPNGEAIKDMPQIRLTQEIAELQTHLAKLNSKLAEAEGALKMLRNTKRQLREDLNTKVGGAVAYTAGMIVIAGNLSSDRQAEVHGYQAQLSIPHKVCLYRGKG